MLHGPTGITLQLWGRLWYCYLDCHTASNVHTWTSLLEPPCRTTHCESKSKLFFFLPSLLFIVFCVLDYVVPFRTNPNGSFLRVLPDLYNESSLVSPLHAIVSAVALANLASRQNRPDSKATATRNYTLALKLINEVLWTPSEAFPRWNPFCRFGFGNIWGTSISPCVRPPQSPNFVVCSVTLYANTVLTPQAITWVRLTTARGRLIRAVQ